MTRKQECENKNIKIRMEKENKTRAGECGVRCGAYLHLFYFDLRRNAGGRAGGGVIRRGVVAPVVVESKV